MLGKDKEQNPRRTGRIRLNTFINGMPRLQDVRLLLSEAEKNKGCLCELLLRAHKGVFLLSCQSDNLSPDPCWTLYEGESGAQQIWSYMDQNLEMITDVVVMTIGDQGAGSAVNLKDLGLSPAAGSPASPAAASSSNSSIPAPSVPSGLAGAFGARTEAPSKTAWPQQTGNFNDWPESNSARVEGSGLTAAPSAAPSPWSKDPAPADGGGWANSGMGANPQPEAGWAQDSSAQTSGAWGQAASAASPQTWPEELVAPGAAARGQELPKSPSSWPQELTAPTGGGWDQSLNQSGAGTWPPEATTGAAWSQPPQTAAQQPYNPAPQPANLASQPYNPSPAPYDPAAQAYNPAQQAYEPAMQPYNPVQPPYDPAAQSYNPAQPYNSAPQSHIPDQAVAPPYVPANNQPAHNAGGTISGAAADPKMFLSFLDNNRHLTIGELVFNASLPPYCVDAAMRLQELVCKNAIDERTAREAIKIAAENKGVLDDAVLHAAKTKAADNPDEAARKAASILQMAGLLTESDIAQAESTAAKVSGNFADALISMGKVDKLLLESAQKCHAYINGGSMRSDQAIIALHYCSRMRAPLEDALSDLSIDVI